MRGYTEAVSLLNSLQTNASVLEMLRKSGNIEYKKSMPEMIAFVERCGYKCRDFDALNIVHISGTKGKGSTSAFVESIFSQFSIKDNSGITRKLKTGLYTSPHLMEVRERIRINGSPISRDMFAKYFFEVWDRLEESKDSHLPTKKNLASKSLADTAGAMNDKPGYFRYLTLMSFHIFMQEKVDMAIMEVGVGGSFDATNVIQRPMVTAVTSLGIDHTSVLGKTLGEIAAHKAGIFKENVPAISSLQEMEAERVLETQAREHKAAYLEIIKDETKFLPAESIVGLAGLHQRKNAALAIAISREYIRQLENHRGLKVMTGGDINNLQVLPQGFVDGLQSVFWPGRSQILKLAAKTWYIDGAHTAESIEACAQWIGSLDAIPSNITLIFNCTGGRNGQTLLKPLANLYKTSGFFQNAIFCANETYQNKEHGAYAPDLTNNAAAHDPLLALQKQLASDWKSLIGDHSSGNIAVFSSVEEAVDAVENESNVLVTGSLHLVGGLMTILNQKIEK